MNRQLIILTFFANKICDKNVLTDGTKLVKLRTEVLKVLKFANVNNTYRQSIGTKSNCSANSFAFYSNRTCIVFIRRDDTFLTILSFFTILVQNKHHPCKIIISMMVDSKKLKLLLSKSLSLARSY